MKKRNIHLVVIFMALSLLSACSGRDGAFDMRKPYSLDLTPPPGPYEYEEGWSDGCESGSHAYSEGIYKLLGAFDLQMNTELRSNKMYYQAWKDAFLYCSLYWEATNSDKI